MKKGVAGMMTQRKIAALLGVLVLLLAGCAGEDPPVTTQNTEPAAVYPDLSGHQPYLFVDENGLIRPDDVLTCEELTLAMRALVTEGEVLGSLELPSGVPGVTKRMLRSVLLGLFPEERLTALEAVAEGVLTRSEFAGIMNCLLSRGGETVTVTGEQVLPRDLDLHRQDAGEILEATLVHEVSEKGKTMLEAVLEMHWEPSFTDIGGWLYYADETGSLLRDGQVGNLTFDRDGRYTCGDGELDAIVAELLNGFIVAQPEAERVDILYTAFEYTRDSFDYLNRGLIAYGADGWENEKALEMFQTGRGNCYSFAAAFCALARGLGYDARCISGQVLALRQPHGWVEFEVDGEKYYFDPELAYADLIGDRDNWGYDMFMIPMDETWRWRYIPF